MAPVSSPADVPLTPPVTRPSHPDLHIADIHCKTLDVTFAAHFARSTHQQSQCDAHLAVTARVLVSFSGLFSRKSSVCVSKRTVILVCCSPASGEQDTRNITCV